MSFSRLPALLPILAILVLVPTIHAGDQEKTTPKPALSATLIANKDTYTLDPAQSGEAFRDSLKNLPKSHDPAPAAPKVDFTLRITNNSQADQTFAIGGDESQLDLKLEGKGAVTIDNLIAMTMEFRSGAPVTLAPGKTYDIAITSLSFGSRGIGRLAYFTEAGDYKLTATLITTQNEKELKISSDAVAFKVKPAGEK